MRRRAVLAAAPAALAAAAIARPVAAQEASPAAATAGHPLVGTWYLDTNAADPANAFEVFVMHADGTYVEANADGSVRLGAWEATGPTTANLTIAAYTKDADGANLGATVIRLVVELNPDGDSYEAHGTIELVAPDGTRSGQAGPVGGHAWRFPVEAPGEPAMTPAELFGGAGATTATPAP